MEKPKSVADMLAEGQNPNKAVNTVNADTNLLGKFVELLLAKEAREAQSAQAEEDRRKAINAQRERNAKDQDSKALLKQARCKHLKGGKRGPKTQNKDYAVYQFRFINFTEYIRCRICGMRWYKEDTADYLNRKGRKISNHTKIGWREAVAMCDGSTDTMSASEAIPQAMPGAQTSTYVDAAGQPVSPRIIDTDGKPVENFEL